jgi:trans-aconitate methyltransferase
VSIDRKRGATFRDEDVVNCYACRPPYPVAVFERLLTLAPSRDSLLDLGCGPGKITQQLAGHFKAVTAIDPSAAMLAAARDSVPGDNISWVQANAESATLGGPHDLAVAAASIHWMNHETLFPRLGACLGPAAKIAIVDGDGAYQPPWAEPWADLMARWVPRLTGQPFDPEGFTETMRTYRRWIDIQGEETYVSAPFSQPIDDFITCQHSRQTFARSRMGAAAAAEFDAELANLLSPYANDGVLSYSVETQLAWGAIIDLD